MDINGVAVTFEGFAPYIYPLIALACTAMFLFAVNKNIKAVKSEDRGDAVLMPAKRIFGDGKAPAYGIITGVVWAVYLLWGLVT